MLKTQKKLGQISNSENLEFTIVDSLRNEKELRAKLLDTLKVVSNIEAINLLKEKEIKKIYLLFLKNKIYEKIEDLEAVELSIRYENDFNYEQM